MSRVSWVALGVTLVSLGSVSALADGWSCGSYCLGVDLSSAQATSLGNVDLQAGAGKFSLADAFQMLQQSCERKAGFGEGVLAANFTVSEDDQASQSSGWVRIGWTTVFGESSSYSSESSVFVQPATEQQACVSDPGIASDSAPIVDDTFVPPGGVGGS